MLTASTIVTLGSIGRPYALRGWMRLNSFTSPPENILSYPHLLIQQNHQWMPFKIAAHEQHAADIVIQLDDCHTPEDAKRYTNCLIGVTRDQLPPLTEGEYYWSDLEGLQVINQQGDVLGSIDHLFETPANDVIVIKGKDGEHLLPYVKEVILNIDLEKKEMHVEWTTE